MWGPVPYARGAAGQAFGDRPVHAQRPADLLSRLPPDGAAVPLCPVTTSRAAPRHLCGRAAVPTEAPAPSWRWSVPCALSSVSRRPLRNDFPPSGAGSGRVETAWCGTACGSAAGFRGPGRPRPTPPCPCDAGRPGRRGGVRRLALVVVLSVSKAGRPGPRPDPHVGRWWWGFGPFACHVVGLGRPALQLVHYRPFILTSVIANASSRKTRCWLALKC